MRETCTDQAAFTSQNSSMWLDLMWDNARWTFSLEEALLWTEMMSSSNGEHLIPLCRRRGIKHALASQVIPLKDRIATRPNQTQIWIILPLCRGTRPDGWHFRTAGKAVSVSQCHTTGRLLTPTVPNPLQTLSEKGSQSQSTARATE